MDKHFGNYYAIIIGIDNYESSAISRLHTAKKDAKDLYEFLIKKGGYTKENTMLIVDEEAIKEKIQGQIETFSKKVTNNDTLLFYFSGHGDNDNSSFVLPLYNFNRENESTFFSGEELINLFSTIHASNILFLLDTCYAGILAKGTDVQSEKNFEYLSEKLVRTDISNSRVLIASCLPEESSYEIKNENIENGIFTHCLLKALNGACQSEKGNKVLILDLLRYLMKNVSFIASQSNLKQTCAIKTSTLYQNFPVCYTSAEVDYTTQLPRRYINAIIDLEEDSNTLVKQFADGLTQRQLDSKFTYWGEEVTKKYIELLNDNKYSMPKNTKHLISQNIGKIVSNMNIQHKGIRVISLGIGDGHKDAVILNKLCDMTKGTIDYWIIEFSYEMLKIGLKNVQEDIGENINRINTKLFQTDFLDLGILSDLMNDDKINLFMLLGNTLGNFTEDVLLNKIDSVMKEGDFFLIDNQIKGENKLNKAERRLLNEMYNTKKYKEYIFSILKNAQIYPGDGNINTRITDYNSQNAILRKFNCATVTQEFAFSRKKEVEIGGRKLSFDETTIIPVIYSRKYTKNALNALLNNYFNIIGTPYYLNNKYALILAQKVKKQK